jgi:hypothetical protein
MCVCVCLRLCACVHVCKHIRVDCRFTAFERQCIKWDVFQEHETSFDQNELPIHIELTSKQLCGWDNVVGTATR